MCDTAPAMASDAAAVCAICQADVDGGTEAFACGHVLHSECFAEYKAMHPVAADDLKCPTCKLSANMLKISEERLFGARWQDRQPDTLGGSGSGLSPAERVVPQVAVEEDVIPPTQPYAVEEDAIPPGQLDAVEESAIPPGQPVAVGEDTGETSVIDAGEGAPAAAGSAALAPTMVYGIGGSIFPKFPEPTVYCTTCGSECVISAVRVLSKREGSWRCCKCRCKITALYRGFGGWPSQGFTSLTDEEKQKFYKEVQDKSAEEIVASAKKLLTKFESHVKFYAESGKHLPLSVWAAKGFNVDRIRTLTPQSDIQMHNILGECYRVQLLTTGRSGEEGLKQEDVKAARGKKRAAAVTAAVAGEQQSKVEDAKSSSSRDSSSSSSSSSSSDGASKKNKRKKGKKDKKAKKSKKGKKDKKAKKSKKGKKDTDVEKQNKQEKKEAEKVARAASKAEEQGKAKALKAKETLARQAEAKLVVAKRKLEAALCDPATLRVPVEISALAKSAYEKVQHLTNECVAVLADPDQHDLSFSSIKEVQAVIEQAKNAEGLVITLTKKMSKFGV